MPPRNSHKERPIAAVQSALRPALSRSDFSPSVLVCIAAPKTEWGMDSPDTLYLQIAQTLAASIRAGVLARGERLPSLDRKSVV